MGKARDMKEIERQDIICEICDTYNDIEFMYRVLDPQGDSRDACAECCGKWYNEEHQA